MDTAVAQVWSDLGQNPVPTKSVGGSDERSGSPAGRRRSRPRFTISLTHRVCLWDWFSVG